MGCLHLTRCLRRFLAFLRRQPYPQGVRPLRGLAILGCMLSVSVLIPEGAQARRFDTWSEATTTLAGSMTPWEPKRTLGMQMDPSGIDVFRCPLKAGRGRVAIRVAYASPNGRRSFSILEQPNAVRCVRTSLRGYGKVGKVVNLGYAFDIYARCGKPRCPAKAVTKGAIVQSRPYPKIASPATIRIRAIGLTYDEVREITSGLNLVAFN